MANIDPDVAVMLDAIEARLAAVEANTGNEAEVRASVDFNMALFSALSAAEDRAQVWADLANYLRSR